ncbi:MAG TPA: hypothetical protein VG322_16505 [Candidatus Acidoferrales bacterium]|jgi:hypothetical protein|nr:hypothetical protein [Candidatus Acidoferrales bacterium]
MKSSFRLAALAGLLAAGAVCAALLLPALAQETPSSAGQEVATNLATGRVLITVVKDAILIATVENPIEAGTRPPTPVELDSTRAGIILGPVDWFSPSTQLQIANLDKELPHLKARTAAPAPAPHLVQTLGGDQASDIESTGQGFGERLNQVAKGLRSNVNLSEDESFAQLIIADYLSGYGPEVWQLSYSMKQEQQKGDYWETRILRPTYLQFWPPEKGQPKTILEFDYPAQKTGTSLLDLLKQKDPRLDRVRNSDPQMAMVASQIQSDSTKLYAADTTQFLRAALAAVTPPETRQTMSVIGVDKGFAWILRPPAEPEHAAPQQTAEAQAQEQKERPADAPSLLKH